jgi:protocatechuate 3,4-dioxygenase, alpha subunit
MTLAPTPSQTVGPYFTLGLCVRQANELVREAGAVRIAGRVLDGAGDAVSDALVEIWQADQHGEYRGNFGWGRCGTDGEGRFSFATVKPGAVDGQAPHLSMLVFARGLLKPVCTRMYFPDEREANAQDPVLSALPESDRATLVAESDEDSLRFDVRLQGDDQTAFFAL